MARNPGSDPLKQQILRAATDLFSENGVDGTSLRMIADQVGVTKGAIYHYFPSKDELHASIHLSRIDTALAELEQVTSSVVSNREKVRQVIWIMLNSIATHQAEFTVMLREGVASKPLHWQILAEKRERYRSLVQGVLENGASSGEFDLDDPQTVAFALIGMCNWSYTWIGVNSDTPVDKVADMFSNIFLEGIVAKPSGADPSPGAASGVAASDSR
jgi:AcrR family transcriptional regulator